MQYCEGQDHQPDRNAPQGVCHATNRRSTLREKLALLLTVSCIAWPAYASGLLFDEGYASPVFWIGAAIAIVVGLSVSLYRQDERIKEKTQDRARRISEVEKLQQAMREAGSTAESKVAELVLEIAREFDPRATVQTGLVINYQNPRPDQMPKFEVDCLLTWQFGLMLIEVKNWKGAITIFADEWVIEKQSALTRHKSPIDQSAPKKRALEQLLKANTPDFPVESVVVLSHENVTIPANAPLAVMCPTDLRFYFRTLYHAAMQRAATTPAQIDVIRHQIDRAVDRAEDAKHQFLLQLAQRKIGAFEYLELDEKLKKIKEEALPLPPSPWHFATTYIPLLLYMLVAHLPFFFQEKHQLPQSPAASASTGSAVSPQIKGNGSMRKSTTKNSPERTRAQ